LEAGTCFLAHELIANSRTALIDAEASELVLPRKRTVIYNGVDVHRYRAAILRTSGQLRLLIVGALAARKGQEFALRALALIVDAGVDAVLTLVGEGPDESMLKALASDLELVDRVRFAGPTLDPRPNLHECDIFVLPSRQEGFSNALLEAMASGLPVVATNVGGNAEALMDGEGGIIVPPRDPAAMAAALIDLSRRRGEFHSMGAANRSRVAQQFTLERSAFQLANWYRGDGGE
jgi:glycosyltransferase involved in cell wall biosynthesis